MKYLDKLVNIYRNQQSLNWDKVKSIDEDKEWFYNYGQDCEFMVQKDYGRA